MGFDKRLLYGVLGKMAVTKPREGATEGRCAETGDDLLVVSEVARLRPTDKLSYIAHGCSES